MGGRWREPGSSLRRRAANKYISPTNVNLEYHPSFTFFPL
jgi:hypothetical protein